jgi:hypothetical protein
MTVGFSEYAVNLYNDIRRYRVNKYHCYHIAGLPHFRFNLLVRRLCCLDDTSAVY